MVRWLSLLANAGATDSTPEYEGIPHATEQLSREPQLLNEARVPRAQALQQEASAIGKPSHHKRRSPRSQHPKKNPSCMKDPAQSTINK